MNKYMQLFLLPGLFFIEDCKEPYFPEIDQAEKMLVVDGLLTDESNVISVSLTNAAPFRDHAYFPEVGAYVVVFDDLGKNYALIEKTPGHYESQPSNYEYGRIYTLVIRTKENKYFKSTPQTLFPRPLIEDVSATIAQKTIQTTKDGKLLLQTLPGLEFSTILYNDTVNSNFYRFSNTILVEYKEKQKYLSNPDTLPELFNCWKIYKPNQFFNLNENEFNDLDIHKHSLAFCPIDTTFFTIVEEFYKRFPLSSIYYTRWMYYFAFSVKQFRLNKDVHQYFKSINQQLESNNRIFDPVSFQVRGNISCENDPEEPVLGVFEVSSTSLRTYKFSDFFPDGSVKFEEIEAFDLNDLSLSGKVYNQYPSFWIYNY